MILTVDQLFYNLKPHLFCEIFYLKCEFLPSVGIKYSYLCGLIFCYKIHRPLYILKSGLVLSGVDFFVLGAITYMKSMAITYSVVRT